MDVLKTFAAQELSLEQVLMIIDQSTAQIALIVDSQKRLLATVTDGDVRRGLLAGLSLQDPVSKVMNINFLSAGDGLNDSEILSLMKANNVHQMPVLTPDGRVSRLILLEELLSPLPLPNSVVLMAGGKGTRLLPYTKDCPKPMLRVNDKPILQILLEMCINTGFSSFYFSVNYLKDQIVDYFGDGSDWGVSINYLIETEPLGTAGSLSLLPKTLSHPLLVLNGDVLTKLNLAQLLQFHSLHKAVATLSVREHLFTSPYGVVKANGVELAEFVEKPTLRQFVNAGVYALNPSVLALLDNSQCIDMPHLLQSVQQRGDRVVVFPIFEYWIDVGLPETLRQVNIDWNGTIDI